MWIFFAFFAKKTQNTMDQPKIARLLKLIALLSGNRIYSLDELADTLEISQRTVYRYIETFQEAGFSITRVGPYQYHMDSVGDSVRDISQIVHFSEEEALIVNRLIDSLDPDNSLKAGLKRKLAAVYDSVNLSQYIGNRNVAKIVVTLPWAMKEKKVVEIRDYVSSNAGDTRSYLLEPFEFTSNYSDVWAFDVRAGINKRFKVYRIGEVVKKDDPWTKEYAHHSEPMDAFHCHGSRELHVVLKLNNAARNIIVEEFPMTEPDIRPIENTIIGGSRDQAWLYDGICRDIWGIGRFVMGQQWNVEVVECDELKAFILDTVDHILELYGKE